MNISGITLKFIIENLWNVTDEMLIGAPKWLDEDRWDVVAKMPPPEPGSDAFVDYGVVLPLIKALLADRFKLAVHSEDRMIQAYTLTAGKPKFKKADPASRTRFTEGPAPDGKDPRNSSPVLTAGDVSEHDHGAVCGAVARDCTGLYTRPGC